MGQAKADGAPLETAALAEAARAEERAAMAGEMVRGVGCGVSIGA